MSDHGSAGRMVSLVPITWREDFPLIGLPGNLRKAPNTWIKPDTGHLQEPRPSFIRDDDFENGKLNRHWQWNHVPDDTKWSLTEQPGVLRLHSLPAADFYGARNSICQRPPGPESITTVELSTSGMIAGDTAGLALLSSPYAWIGVAKTAEGYELRMLDNTGNRGGRRDAQPRRPNQPTASSSRPPEHLWLRVACNFDTDAAIFSWSTDGTTFAPLGKPFTMTFQLRTFQGVRPALFHFNTEGRPGGYVDFDNFVVIEPRARGKEREIPVGKVVTLTSGADGSRLSADTENNLLINAVAGSADFNGGKTQIQVVERGQGRVALQVSNGRFISVADDSVVLKAVPEDELSNAESFQWVNLMRGDVMLMSLVNHRYLTTTPNVPGRVTASATGPNPARKGGACFKWQTP